MRTQTKAPLVVLAASAWVAAALLNPALLPRPAKATGTRREPPTNALPVLTARTADPAVDRGQKLFEHNCAHCHGDDARGDEGPSLHNLTLSDARIAKKIREGVKGEMPRFGSKLGEAEVAALIAYLRTLRD